MRRRDVVVVPINIVEEESFMVDAGTLVFLSFCRKRYSSKRIVLEIYEP